MAILPDDPGFHPFKEDGCGVIAGTTNHIAPCDWTQLVVENSRITEIREGGAFGKDCVM